MLVALALPACSRRAPGDVGRPALALVSIRVVSQDDGSGDETRAWLRAELANDGDEIYGATVVLVSPDPAVVLEEAVLRFGAIGAGGRAASLDTASVRHPAGSALDPSLLGSVIVSFGPGTAVHRSRSAGRESREHFVDVTNRTPGEIGVRAKLLSANPALRVTDARADAPRVAPDRRVSTRDLVAFDLSDGIALDPRDVVFGVQVETGRTADATGDGRVDALDVSLVSSCTGRDPAQECRCAAGDLDADGDVDGSDLARVKAALGRGPLAVAAPDAVPPLVTIVEPAPGATVASGSVRVSGVASEPLFALRIGGVVVSPSPFAPYEFSALVDLASAGPASLAVTATDLACNDSIAAHPVVVDAGDRAAPIVRIAAPAQVTAGTGLRVAAEAEDDSGVAALELRLDGAVVASSATASLLADLVAPDGAGATLALEAVARDAAGHTGRAAAHVAVVAESDSSPPHIEAVRAPPGAAPASRIWIAADVRDDRGVAEVRFRLGGGAPSVDTVPPFEVMLDVPSDAAPGGSLDAQVEAFDHAGLRGSASAQVAIVATADVTPPSGVVLSAPDRASPSDPVALAATATDDVGIARIRFYADGVLAGEDASAPYELLATIPAALAPGASVAWSARATDFAGNDASSAPALTQIVAPRRGIIAGEVYDDTNGRPLAGAFVRVEAAAGVPPAVPVETTTDAHGRYRVSSTSGTARIRIGRTGYTEAWREVSIAVDAVVTPLDARLVPRAAATSISRRDGGRIGVPGGGDLVEIAPGALAEDALIAITRVPAQALPGELPFGWSPVAALDVSTGGVALTAPVYVELDDPAAALATGTIPVHFDASALAWRRAALEPGAPPGRARFALSAPTTLALLRADVAPEPPPLPPEGATLQGVGAVALPPGASLALSPSPRIVFAGPNARADVTATLAGRVPSGTRIEVVLRESHQYVDGTWLEPDGFREDLRLYAAEGGPTAAFVVTPDPTLDALLLREGAVTLEAEPAPADRAIGVLGPSGGALATPGGVRFEALPGALAGEIPVVLEALDPASLALPPDPRFDVLAGVQLELGGSALASAGVLGIPTPSGVGSGDVLLLVSLARIGAATELELVGIAQLGGSRLVIGAGGLGLPFPGVRREGRFVLVRARGPLAFLSGLVAGASGEAIVRASTLPFVARASASATGDARWALASTPGDAEVSVLDASGAAAAVIVNVPPSGASSVDLRLAPGSPRVVSVDPASGATNVDPNAALRIRFDRPIDPASVSASSITLHAGPLPVPATVALSADRLVAVLRPLAPLAGETRHVLRAAPTLRDAFGGTLAGNAPDGSFTSELTTIDTTPPPRPAPGRISQSIPRDGTTEIVGTLGAAEPGNVVVATNRRSGATTSVIAGADGSFALQLAAGLADEVTLVLRDANGRETSFDPGPFADPDGMVVVGAAGGVVDGAGGVQAIVPPGAVPDGTPIRVAGIQQADMAVAVPSFARFVSAIEVEMGGVVASDEIDVALPIPAGVSLDPAKELLVYAQRDFFGTPVVTQVNVAHVVNGRIETASPPFPGVRRSGKYAVAEGISALEQLTILPALKLQVAAAIGSVRTGVDAVFIENFGINDDGSDRAIAIVAIPRSVPFEITLVNGSPTPVATVPFGPLAGSGLTQIRVGPPDDGSPFEATTILPADQSEEVLIHPVVSVAFNKAIDEASVLASFQLVDESIASPSQARVPGQITFETVNGESRIVRFVPDRRLKVGTQYRIQLQGICTFLGAASGGACSDPLGTPDAQFITFRPRRINGVELTDANDVSAWDPISGGAPTDRLLVAHGSEQSADTTGVVLIDVSEPQAPQILSETAITGRTLAVLGVDDASITASDGSRSISGPMALAVSGGIDDTSNLRILEPNGARTKLASVGASLLTSSHSALQGGLVLADVPPFAGVPRGLAFAPLQGGGAAALVATVGLGLQAVSLSNTLGFVRTQPGLFPKGGALAVAAVGDVFALADSRALTMVNVNALQIGQLSVPAKSLAAVRAFTSDDDGDGTIALPAEQRDLVFVGDEIGRFLVVNVTQPSAPALLASIPLPRRARDVAVDPEERLAYAATDEGVIVIDVSRPADPSGLAFVDANADGEDDRILGTLDGIGAAHAIDLSRDGTLLYAADPANEQVHVAFVSTGRFYFDAFDPLIPDASLTPTDYYPDLGTKRLVLRGFEADGSPGQGTVDARVISPAAGVNVAPGSMQSGTAVLSLAATGVVPSQGPIELEFVWRNLAGEEQRTTQRFKVRNNSVTTVEEVLAGRAAFVATTQHGADHDGITARPLQPIAAGYDPTPRPRSFAPIGERKFDFVEEMLNQVGGRSFSAWSAGFRVVLETGIYDSGGQFEKSLRIVKSTLAIPVNRDAGTRSANFRKLMSEYGIAAAAQDAFQHRIVDAETLRMKTLRVEPDRTKPCTSCDVKLNVAATDDTGLYELYTNVVFRFVEDMMARAEAFRDQSAPANADGRWVARTGDPVPTRASDDVAFRDRDDGRRGVSYCFGCKQELETFNGAVSQFMPPDTAEVPLSFPLYQGKLIDTVFPGIVDPAGTKMWPGLRQVELDTHAAFRGHFWAGIDCSGFIQRVAWHAARSNPSNGLSRFWAPTGCGSIATGGAGLCAIVTTATGANDHLIGSASYFTDGRHAHRIQQVGVNANPVHRGDLRVKDGHVAFLYSDPVAPGDRYYVIHAFGGIGGVDEVREGLTSTGISRFGRKVGVASWATHFQNAILGVSRLLLWE